MKTIGERLEWALTLRDKSIREVQLQLQERSVKGSSYASFHGYVKGGQVPPLELLEAVAGLLEVRPAWLAFGDGEPSPEHDLEVHAATEVDSTVSGERRMLRHDETPTGRRLSVVARGIETALGYPLPHGSAARVALVRAFRRLWMAEFLNGRIPANANDQQLADLDMELAERVGAAARAPLRELRLGPSLAWEDYEDYILSVAALVARTIRAANLSPPPSEGEEDSQE